MYPGPPHHQTVLTSADPSCQCHCQECIVSVEAGGCRGRDLHHCAVQDLHFVLERARDPETEDVARQGIVPMETPFLMDQVMDDGMAACSLM